MALGHATRMAEMDFFSHTDPATNSQPWDRAVHAGYDYSAIAENIAQGQPAVEDVMNAWMNSPGHRANILDWYPSELGIGIYQGGTHGTYWVQSSATAGKNGSKAMRRMSPRFDLPRHVPQADVHPGQNLHRP